TYLVLLVLGDEIVHVALGFRELHLVHALAGVPMEEGLATEHGSELLRDPLEELLDRGRIADEGGGHLQSTGRNVTDGSLHVSGDPVDEVRRVLVLDRHHLVVDLAHGHASTEHGSDGEITSVAGVASGHHVLRIEHLLGQLGDGEGVVGRSSLGGERGESGHEEVETREGNHVDCELAEISIELTRETEAGGHSRHGHGYEVVQVSIVGVGQLECTEANLVKGLVVDAEGLVGVLDELVDRERRIVGLDNGVRDLERGNDGEGAHDSVRVLLTDLGDQQGAHSGSSSTSERVGKLESLKAVASLSLLADNIEDLVHELGSLGVVSLCPVVSCSTLAEDEVVGAEHGSVGSSADRVHGSGLQIDEDGAGNILSSASLIVVDVDPLQLEIRLASVCAIGLDAVLVRDHFPELGSNLVSALASLDVDDLAHFVLEGKEPD
ncbi:hypothetical protein PMAYCL1PPCAC_06142, partial [Pristionchus mayeri]